MMATRMVFVLAVALAAECPVPVELQSVSSGDDRVNVLIENEVDVEVKLTWVNFQGQEVDQNSIMPLSSEGRTSFPGHVFRVRAPSGELLAEHRMGTRKRQSLTIAPCGPLGAASKMARQATPRDAEFAALLHDVAQPCLGTDTSLWSCVRSIGAAELAARDPTRYGIQPNETNPRRHYATVDTLYTDQIPNIPRVSDGPGYAKMTFTQPLREALTEWYAGLKNHSLKTHGPIPGGYTNNDIVPIDKLNLDDYPRTHAAVVREMRLILEWWTNLKLRHTSTFGVRVYRRNSALIDHVDRMDTHLASAVIQIDQRVDKIDGGWPLELLLPNRRVAEVYTQAGELILYEGAWLRHGRPMRFKGDEFANVFSHFSPPDWNGPVRGASHKELYYGIPDDRLTTLADDGYSTSDHYARPGTPFAPPRDASRPRRDPAPLERSEL